ncbi:methyltransferase domain-containing protein [Kitasatospora sp. NPDC088391]|uniref:methyltransferase domain-containing protein n=1 Tax=Kitasatospora sp. NPDC088391 TaxID=3364074 RepID=UPI0037F8E8CD
MERSRCSLSRPDRPDRFTLGGREWDLLDGVFAPVYSPSTETALDLLGLTGERAGPWPGSFLEIGAGTGVVAVTAALAGCRRVVASDVNPAAVRNAELNIARHRVGRRARAVHGDMFAGLTPGERFDTVFWSSNYVLAPDWYAYRDLHEAAYVDVGYRAHRAFVEGAHHWLADGGSVLLHFSSRGDLDALRRIAADTGRTLRTRRSVHVPENVYGDMTVEHLLLEIVAD